MREQRQVGLSRIALTFLRLGIVGFGGPASHIALMQEQLVERRGWVQRDRFKEALGVTSLIPGPNSSELAIHTGYLMGGQAGALLFGGGYVLIPLLQPEVIARGWLTKAQFLDGIALGQATPGPIVTTSAFVGYAVTRVPGAVVATVAIYVPSFLFVMAGTGPFLRSFRDRPAVSAFTRGVSAAALGAIAGAEVTLGRVGLNTPLKAAIGIAAVVALLRRVPIWLVLPAAGAISILVGVIR
ncbi:MAG TPA: chromate transporter [Actinomycetota bacterium]